MWRRRWQAAAAPAAALKQQAHSKSQAVISWCRAAALLLQLRLL